MLACILSLSVAAAVPVALPPGVPAGTPIVAVKIERHNVFDLSDPGSSAWPYRLANSLHIVTRERFIRSLLLFKVGDPLDPAKLAESARLLRATGFLSPVDIRVRKADGGAEVVVETHDQWTLEVSFNYGVYGNRQKAGLSLADTNFLGWGKTLAVETESNEERRFFTVAYTDPLFLGTRWRLGASRQDASDGTADAFKLEYPFFALDTPRAGGVEFRRGSLKEWLYAAGHRAAGGDATRRTMQVWGGLKLGSSNTVVNRLTLGFFVDTARFAGWTYRGGAPFPTPTDYALQGVQVGWEHQVDRWEVVQGFRAWVRQEDVPLGPNWEVTAGFSLPALGGDAGRVALHASTHRGVLRGRWYSWLDGAVDGRLDHGNPRNTVFHLEVGTARTGAVGWRGRIAADVGHELDRDRQLTLGADVGLRGWNPDFFDGTSRVVGNAEFRRKLTGEVLHLAVFGVGVFADAGKTWDPRVGPSTGGWRADVGAGLTAEITRAAILRIVRLEVAFPDDGSGPVFLATGGSLF